MPRKTILFILALILFHLVNNYVWCSNDWFTMEDDMGVHLESHLLLHADMKELLFSQLNPISKIGRIAKLIQHYSTFAYPALVYFISSSLNTIFHSSHILITRLSNILYFSILIVSIYLIGKACAGRSFGLIAATLTSFYPAIAGMSRLYTLDFPLTCVTAFAIYRLIRTDYFTRVKDAVFFGFALGFGLLVKGQILFFILGPFLYVAVKGLLKRQKFKMNTMIVVNNVIIAFLIAGFISSVWWLPHFKYILRKLFEQAVASYIAGEPPPWIGGLMELEPFSRDWIFSYAYFSLNNISPVLFGLFLLGLASFFRLKINHKGILLTWLLIPYVILMVYSIKKDRYFMPTLPVIALISTSFFYAIKNKMIQKLFISLVVAFAVIQFMFISYSNESARFYWHAEKNSIFYIITPMQNPIIYGYGEKGQRANFYECVCINPHKSNIETVALNLLNNVDKDLLRQGVNIGIWDFDFALDTGFTLRYIWKSRNPNIKFYRVGEHCHGFPLALGEKEKNSHNAIKRCTYDYIIVLARKDTLTHISNRTTLNEVVKKFSKIYVENPSAYVLVKTQVILPENYIVFLFKQEVA